VLARLRFSANSYRVGNSSHQGLGDWSPILHHFDQYCDGKAVDRLREMVEQKIANAS